MTHHLYQGEREKVVWFLRQLTSGPSTNVINMYHMMLYGCI